MLVKVEGWACLARDGKSILIIIGNGPYGVRELFIAPGQALTLKDPGDLDVKEEIVLEVK